jgi:ribosomal protein S18 acetylase RimI-like enzyme
VSSRELVWLFQESLDTREAAAVDDGLDAFNRALPALDLVRPLCCAVRRATGECVGGARARSWGAACELQQLWVDVAWRRQGLGSRLVSMVEIEARNRGCDVVYLDTFTFQAPGFYGRLGYRELCRIEGFPDGMAKLIMAKRLAASVVDDASGVDRPGAR